jgi:hypothetical protein
MNSKMKSSKAASYAKGGSGKMAGQSNAGPSQSGKVSSSPGGGDKSFKVSGGKGKMAGFTGATPAKPC